ncbi:hypothetical protein [Chitinophaga qingshengii]|uniref:Uncharacterized protein n=1 Tax=Chitinophaga qingshengii TaxID=1569794 RepID=A0ABR7TKF4_9BACT|nr:hypothetical protein [Chitinophaga qingshengii]MBC9929529.1 hypothetical protein [Chitinophaga qingshengii]
MNQEENYNAMIQGDIYRISYSTDPLEIGVFPQASFSYFEGVDSDDISYFSDLSKVTSGIKVVAGANFTDFLNVIDCGCHEGLICSEEALLSIQELKLPPKQSLRINALNKKKLSRSYWVNLFDHNFYDFIDYAKSRFIAKGFVDSDILIEEEDRQRFEERYLQIKRQSLFAVYPDEVYLKKELIDKVDLFSFPKYGIDLYATANFYRLYLERKMSGLQFEPIKSFFFY